MKRRELGRAGEWTAREVATKFVTIIGDSPRVDILVLEEIKRLQDR